MTSKKGNPYRGYKGRFTTGASGEFNVDSAKVSPEIRRAMQEVKKIMRKQRRSSEIFQ